jgi:K+-sensing histidine kinase KdpD
MTMPEVRVEQSLAQYRSANEDIVGRHRERVVVALTGGQESTLLLRRGARHAGRADGQLHAVHVSRPGQDTGLAPAALTRLRRLAEDLGGTFHHVVAYDEAEAVLDLARGVDATTTHPYARVRPLPYRRDPTRALGRTRLLEGWALALTAPSPRAC